MLIDSNIIIYSTKPEHHFLRQLIAEEAPVVSAVSYVEVLGYHRLSEQERHALEDFFAATIVLPISRNVIEQAVNLRQIRKMTLADALIAATALVHNLKLVTRNVKDYDWIANLILLNPFDDR